MCSQPIFQGLALVQLIDTFYDRKYPEDKSHLTEIQKWLNIFILLIDITKDDAVNCIKLFVCDKYNFAVRHVDHLSTKV